MESATITLCSGSKIDMETYVANMIKLLTNILELKIAFQGEREHTTCELVLEVQIHNNTKCFLNNSQFFDY